MTMDERMTICNMSIEGGARVGYVNPDRRPSTTSRGRPFAPQGEDFERACRGGARWPPIPTRRTTTRSCIDAAAIEPTVTWGINPGQSVGVDERVCRAQTRDARKRWRSWASAPASPIEGHEDRRRVRRLVHQRPALRSARGGARSSAATTWRRT